MGNLIGEALDSMFDLLLEDRVDRVKRMYPENEELHKKIDYLVTHDPTNGKNKYLEWATKQLSQANSPWDSRSNVEQMADNLRIFHQTRQEFEKKNIFDYKDYRQFVEAVNEIKYTSFTLLEKRPVHPEATMLMDVPGKYFLVRVASHEASREYACKAKYCVADPGDGHWREYGREGSNLFYLNINKALFKKAKKRLNGEQRAKLDAIVKKDDNEKEFSDFIYGTILFNYDEDGDEKESPHHRQNVGMDDEEVAAIFNALGLGMPLLRKMEKAMERNARSYPTDPGEYEPEDLRWDEWNMEQAAERISTSILGFELGGTNEWEPGDNEDGPSYSWYVQGSTTIYLDQDYMFDIPRIQEEYSGHYNCSDRTSCILALLRAYVDDLIPSLNYGYSVDVEDVDLDEATLHITFDTVESEYFDHEDEVYRVIRNVEEDDEQIRHALDEDNFAENLIEDRYLIPAEPLGHIEDVSRLNLKNIKVSPMPKGYSGRAGVEFAISVPAPIHSWNDEELARVTDNLKFAVSEYFNIYTTNNGSGWQGKYWKDMMAAHYEIADHRPLPFNEASDRKKGQHLYPTRMRDVRLDLMTDPSNAYSYGRVAPLRTLEPSTLLPPGTSMGKTRPNEIRIFIELAINVVDSVHAARFFKILDTTIVESLTNLISEAVQNISQPGDLGPESHRPHDRTSYAKSLRQRLAKQAADEKGEEETMQEKREALIYELKLRQAIRSILNSMGGEYAERRQHVLESIRPYIRSIVKADADALEARNLKYVLEGGAVADIPHRSTGINVLEDLLKKIVPILEDEYKLLTTDGEQRDSFRSHIINAVQNTLAPSKVNIPAPDDPPPPEEIPTDEGMVVGNELIEEEDVTVSIEDEDAQSSPKTVPDDSDAGKFIDIDNDGKPDNLTLPGDGEEDTFTIPDEEETGRNFAARSFNKIEKQVQEAFTLLANDEDREVFYDYLIANLKLYFDKFEDELKAEVDEPDTHIPDPNP